MEKIPTSAAPMSQKTMGAHIGLHLKNEWKTKSRQLRVNPLLPETFSLSKFEI